MNLGIKEIRDLDRLFLESLPHDEEILKIVLERLSKNPDLLRSGLRELLLVCCRNGEILSEEEAIKEDWRIFYEHYFGFRPSFSGIKFPEPREKFEREILIPKGLTFLDAVDALRGKNRGAFRGMKLIDCKNHIPPEVDIDALSARRADRDYVVFARDCEWSDTAHRNLSPEMVLKYGVVGMTVLERIIFHLKHYDEYEEHLDRDYSQTYCTGSIYEEPDTKRRVVPTVGYQGFNFVTLERTNIVEIYPFPLDTVDYRLRVREVVAL